MSERNNSSGRLRRLASQYEKAVSRARAEQLVARAMSRVRGSRQRRPRAIVLGGVSAALLVVVILGATSSASLPGDTLYPVGRAYEAVGEFAGFVDPVEQRLNEVIALVERGDALRAAAAAEEALSGLGRSVEEIVLPLATTTTTTSTTVPAPTGGDTGEESPPPTAPPAVTVEADPEPEEDPIDSLKVAAELLLSTVREEGTDVEAAAAEVEAAAAELAEAISDVETVLEEEEEEPVETTTTTTTTIPEETTSTTPETTSTTAPEEDSSTTTIVEETTTTIAEEEAGEEGPGPIFLPPEF